MYLKLENVSLEFSDRVIFKNLNFVLNKGDRIGIVGDNGMGKSSLLNIIVRKVDFRGDLFVENPNFGFLSQDDTFSELKLIDVEKEELERSLSSKEVLENSELYANVLERYNKLVNSDEIQREKRLMNIFKFNERLFFEEEKSNLSGGESTKLKLIKLFAKRFDFYLLDEPTNHLDLRSRNVLMKYLDILDTFVVVSHDVELLNRCVNKILFIRDGEVKLYYGNYDRFVEQKMREDEEIKRRKEINERKKEIIKESIENIEKKFNKSLTNLKRRTGGIRKSMGDGRGGAQLAIEKTQKLIKRKIEQMDAIENVELPKDERIRIREFGVPRINNEVLRIEGLRKFYGDFNLSVDLFEVLAYQKVALLGDNGSGKSTLLKVIMGKIEKDGGVVDLGNKVKIGFLSQKNESLSEENTLLQELLDGNPFLDETEIRTALGNFLFKGEDVFRKVSTLSGGEKIRLAFLKVVLQGCNFLLLDEPSNHLDIKSKEILSQALSDYEGTLLVVSHDLYFVNKFATERVFIENGRI